MPEAPAWSGLSGVRTEREFRIGLAVRALRAGEVIAYPTEAVFGLGCDPRCATALARVVHAKGRHPGKGLILIGHTPRQVLEFARDVPSAVLDRILATWPGPHTWVLPAARHVHRLITGGRDSVALRVTAHPLAALLCERFGAAVVSTSANRSGRGPASTAREVRLRLGGRIDFVLDGALGGEAQPSTIRDALSGRVLRGAGV